MDKCCDLYDTSDCPKEYFLHSTANSKVLGKMKNKCIWCAIVKYVGLCSKMYLILEEVKNIKKAKDVKKNLVKKQGSTPTTSTLQQEDLPPWYGCVAFRVPPCQRPAPE